ncbi:MAG: peptidase dimerization domain-containing protein, partial [Ilumatobacter sp.]|nr:peptidase dimerization domain-containing protein [Ilumatobacter sp.]
ATHFRPWADERGLAIDQMIVAEPTRLAPIHGHKGGASLRITVHGESAHSALPQLGKNAIDAAVPLIVAFRDEHERLQELEPSSQLGNGTLAITTIEGGSGSNVIPASCTLTVGRRIVPGEDAEQVYRALEQLAHDACPLPVSVEPAMPPGPDGRPAVDAFYQSPDAALVEQLAAWAGTAPAVAPFGTNALRYSGFARELAVFGPGAIDDAHQATERVAIADLVATAEVYERWLAPS